MYKILRTLPLIALPLLAMESGHADIEKLLKILQTNEPESLFYKALPIVKQYNEQEIKALPIEQELKNYVFELKNQINDKFLKAMISIDEIKTLLNFGADINTHFHGITLLSFLSQQGKYKHVKLLLELGANPNISDSFGSTPLIKIASTFHLSAKEQLKAARVLIENGAQVNAVDKTNNSALSFAAMVLSEDMVKLLLEHGADPNIQSIENGETPLMLTAARKTSTEREHEQQLNIIKMLITYGAKLFTQDKKGKTAFDIAQAKGNTEVANILQAAMIKRGQEIFK